MIGALGSDAHVKASSVHRSLSLKMLTDRLGDYERPSTSKARPEPGLRYQAGPVQGERASGELYKRFQMQREAAMAAREQALAALREAHGTYAQQLAAHYRSERCRLMQTASIAPSLRKQLLDQLAVARTRTGAERRELARDQRAKVRLAHPVPNWLGFLEHEAARGGEQALALLRGRNRQGRSINTDTLTSVERTDGGHVVYQPLVTSVGKTGDVIYALRDGGRVTDRACEIRTDRLTPGAAFLALSLATDRYGVQPLAVTGSEAFKAALIDVAGARWVKVTFSDPIMERARLDAGAAASRTKDRSNDAPRRTHELHTPKPPERQGPER